MGSFLQGTSALGLVSLIRKFSAVSFLFLLRLLTKLLLLLSRPTAVEQKFLKKQVFGSGNELIVEGKKLSGTFFELAWGVPESEISNFPVFQLFLRF